MSRLLLLICAAVLGEPLAGEGAAAQESQAGHATMSDRMEAERLREAHNAYGRGLAGRDDTDFEPLDDMDCMAIWTLTGRDILSSPALYGELGVRLVDAERNWRHYLGRIQRSGESGSQDAFMQSFSAAYQAQLQPPEDGSQLVHRVLERSGRCTVEPEALRTAGNDLLLTNFMVQTGLLPQQYLQSDAVRQQRIQTLRTEVDVCASPVADTVCLLGEPGELTHDFQQAGLLDYAESLLVGQCVERRGVPLATPADICTIDASSAPGQCQPHFMDTSARRTYTYVMNCEIFGG